ncbi:hypothetical protein [Mumia sp. ZJ430]|uniref:hypothetical protein n=1 Tax=Mumia sp. ZJ430 TaxID=2708083 RepID=UPI001423599F|nr:hypothetical protein [Mumia sp. ZJ430]
MLSLRRWILGLTVLLTAFAAALTAAALPASAAPTCTPPAKMVFVDGEYKCVIPGGGGPGQPGDPGDDGGGGPPAPPTCDLEGRQPPSGYDNPSAMFCIGEDVCFDADHRVPLALPDGPKPNEDSEPRVTYCFDTIMGPPAPRRIFWTGEEEIPSNYEQALEAIGRIDLATPVINISPQNRTIVNLDTWFWATGQQQTQTGSSAFGLVAIATFEHLVVTTGDGNTLTCEAASTREEAQRDCRHAYNRASVGGSERVNGRPAYAVTVESLYSLTFEVNGAEVVVPGAPTTLTSPTATAALRVDEVQSVVTPGD